MNKVKLWLIGFIFILFSLFGTLLLTPVQETQAQGGVTGFSSIRLTNFLRLLPRTSLAVTNNGTINATGSFQRIHSATAVGTAGTNIVVEPAGTVLTLINVGANTITITETGVFTSAGNIALGAGDAATLYSNGAAWIQVGASNN